MKKKGGAKKIPMPRFKKNGCTFNVRAYGYNEDGELTRHFEGCYVNMATAYQPPVLCVNFPGKKNEYITVEIPAKELKKFLLLTQL